MTTAEQSFDVSGFSYDPKTGAIYFSGVRRDVLHGAKRRVNHGGAHVMAHRLAWRLYFGCWPVAEIDHKDCDAQNNTIENLREATRQQNNFNRSTTRNVTGEKGVVWDKASHRWQVRVFATPVRVFANASHKISAIVAARLIRRVLHGDFARC